MFGPAGGAGFGLGGYGGTSKGANDSAARGMDIAINAKPATDVRLGYFRYNINTTKYDQGTNLATQFGIPGMNTGIRLQVVRRASSWLRLDRRRARSLSF